MCFVLLSPSLLHIRGPNGSNAGKTRRLMSKWRPPRCAAAAWLNGRETAVFPPRLLFVCVTQHINTFSWWSANISPPLHNEALGCIMYVNMGTAPRQRWWWDKIKNSAFVAQLDQPMPLMLMASVDWQLIFFFSSHWFFMCIFQSLTLFWGKACNDFFCPHTLQKHTYWYWIYAISRSSGSL